MVGCKYRAHRAWRLVGWGSVTQECVVTVADSGAVALSGFRRVACTQVRDGAWWAWGSAALCDSQWLSDSHLPWKPGSGTWLLLGLSGLGALSQSEPWWSPDTGHKGWASLPTAWQVECQGHRGQGWGQHADRNIYVSLAMHDWHHR